MAEYGGPEVRVVGLAEIVGFAGTPESVLEGCESVRVPSGELGPHGHGGLQADDAVVVEDDRVEFGGAARQRGCQRFSRAR